MKTKVFYPVVVGMVFAIFTLFACHKEDSQELLETPPHEMVVNANEANRIDHAVGEVSSLMELAYFQVEENGGRATGLFPECASINVTHQGGITFVTVVFEVECELSNGNIVSGEIQLSYGPNQNDTRHITYHLVDFVLNGNGIVGGGTIFRERNNYRNNPQSTFHSNLTVSSPTGSVGNYEGTKVREWVEGYANGNWSDNVFSITGHRSIVFSNGFESIALVTVALRKEATCPYFVSGKVDLTRNGNNGSLNYGDGICDNTAILTVNGVEYEIILN